MHQLEGLMRPCPNCECVVEVTKLEGENTTRTVCGVCGETFWIDQSGYTMRKFDERAWESIMLQFSLENYMESQLKTNQV
jgi:hypothetical protein